MKLLLVGGGHVESQHFHWGWGKGSRWITLKWDARNTFNIDYYTLKTGTAFPKYINNTHA